MTIEKLSNKLNLNEDVIKSIIIQHHIIENLSPKKNLKKLQVTDLTINEYKELKKIARTLKVSLDSVVAGLLLEFIKDGK